MAVLDPFDATRKFKSLTFFRADGTIWEPGSAIDDARFTERQLRLLYENRRIGYITDAELEALAQRQKDDEQARRDAAELTAGSAGSVARAPVAAADPLLSATAAPSTVDKDAAAQALVDAHTKDELVAKAGDAGVDVKPSDTKPVIAAALVEAGVTAPAAEPAPAAPADAALTPASGETAAPAPDTAPAAGETGSEAHAGSQDGNDAHD